MTSLQRVCCYCDQGESDNAACAEEIAVSFDNLNLNVSVNFVCKNGPNVFAIPLAENCTSACAGEGVGWGWGGGRGG